VLVLATSTDFRILEEILTRKYEIKQYVIPTSHLL